MAELITIQLKQQEVNVLLQLLNKSPITGLQGMRIVLGLDAKVRKAVIALGSDIVKDNRETPEVIASPNEDPF